VGLVEKRFGLNEKQILDAFFSMRPDPHETESQFILRVDDFRLKYN
jgi:hypothetical protein